MHTRENKPCIDDVKINDSNVTLDSEIVIFPQSQTKILPLSDPDFQCSSLSSPVLQDESIPSPIVNVQSSARLQTKSLYCQLLQKLASARWSTQDYRRQRALMKSANSPSQTSISNYFDPVSISTFIDNEDILRTEINRISGNETNKSVAPIMKILYENAQKNAACTSKQTGTMKQSKHLLARFFVSLVKVVMTFYSLILEVLCVFIMYTEVIIKSQKIKEGDYQFDELSEHLKDFKAPPFINIPLDDTRLINRVEYDPITDRFVGLLRNMHIALLLNLWISHVLLMYCLSLELIQLIVQKPLYIDGIMSKKN